MQNKTVSIISTAVMALLFVIGLVLIWNNISIAPSADEDLALTDQEFLSHSYTVPGKDGGKPETITEIDYTVVIDKKKNKAYDLSEGKELNLEKLMKDKSDKVYGSAFKDEDIHYLAEKEYSFQLATLASISYTKWLMYIAFAAIAIFTILNIAKNPKRFMRSAIGFAALAIIAFICFKMASPVGEGKMLETSNYTDAGFQWTGAGILLTSVLVIISLVLIVWQSVVNLLRFFTK
ncbi:MAG: hypothetical protein AB8B74_15600 [Crocinitomicaceae bacterium]